jgi:ABC-type branched-subunit amino acid transport system ATPase component
MENHQNIIPDLGVNENLSDSSCSDVEQDVVVKHDPIKKMIVSSIPNLKNSQNQLVPEMMSPFQ